MNRGAVGEYAATNLDALGRASIRVDLERRERRRDAGRHLRIDTSDCGKQNDGRGDKARHVDCI